MTVDGRGLGRGPGCLGACIRTSGPGPPGLRAPGHHGGEGLAEAKLSAEVCEDVCRSWGGDRGGGRFRSRREHAWLLVLFTHLSVALRILIKKEGGLCEEGKDREVRTGTAEQPWDVEQGAEAGALRGRPPEALKHTGQQRRPRLEMRVERHLDVGERDSVGGQVSWRQYRRHHVLSSCCC